MSVDQTSLLDPPRKVRRPRTATRRGKRKPPPAPVQAPEQTVEAAPSARVPISQLLVQALVAARTAKDAARAGKSRDHLYISEAGVVQGESACHRKLWYSFHNAPQDPLTPDTMLNFEVGDAVGWRAANLMAKTGAVEKVELHLALLGGRLTGRLDVLLADDRVVEVKTTTLKQRKYLPRPEHLTQCLLYIHALRQTPEYARINEGVVLYVLKEPTRGQPVSIEFPALYDAAVVEAALAAFRAAYDVARGDVLPARPQGFSPSSFPCSYCSCSSACWSSFDRTPEDKEVSF